MEPQVAQWIPPQENPNFVSRPPDPGAFNYYATSAWDAIYHSPFSGVYRATQLGIESSGALNGLTWNPENGTTFDQNDADRQYNVLTPKEATQKYGLDGQLKFDEPINESAARLMYQRKLDENDRAYILQTGATSGFRHAAGMGVGMAATLVDPLNVAMMFTPVVGEVRMASMVAKYGVTRARLAAGAIEGFVGSAMAEPFVLLPAMQEQANYGLADSALNLGFGAVLGAGLHAGLGAVGDRIRALKPKEANAIFESAMNDVLQDRPVSAPAKVFEFTDTFEAQNESIASAAIQLEDGTILTGRMHATIAAEMTPDQMVGALDGFMTDSGRFVNRQEALDLAEKNNQLTQEYSDIYAGARKDGSEDSKEFLDGGLSSEELNLPGDKSFFAPIKPPKQLPSINDIPLRDSRGKFLSKARRLELLQEKITAEQSRGESLQGDSRQVNTQIDQSRVNPNDLPKSMDDSEVTRIDTETADLEADLRGLDEADGEAIKSRVEELTKHIGDTAAREKAVNAATDCIIRNLI